MGDNTFWFLIIVLILITKGEPDLIDGMIHFLMK